MRKFLKITVFLSLSFLTVCLSFFAYAFISVKNYSFDETKLTMQEKKFEYYDDNNNLVYADNFNKNYSYVKISELNPYTLNAFIAIEDKRFYSHNGLDYKRILGATVNNVKAGKLKEGASTISQQLIKNTHLTNEKTFKRKFAEIKLTLKLEKTYTKDEILEKYVNVIYFGKGAYGIENASKIFFNKHAKELTLSESALLAGLIKSPKAYSPTENYENSIKRRNLVLKQMLEQNLITKSDYESAINEKITITNESENSYLTSYILATKSEFEKVFFLEPYSYKNVKIYTYLDTDIQKELSEIQVENIENYDSSKIVINSKNSGVIAYYGKNSNLKRCPASCVKPWLVYAPMINENYITESDIIIDENVNFNGYEPKNFGGKFNGAVTVKDALKLSLNVPSVKLLSGFGLDKTNEYLDKMNIKTKVTNLSTALGSIDGGLTLQELVDLYSSFSNQGNFSNSSFIKKITVNGKTVYENNVKYTPVFSEETSYIINDILRDAVKDGTSKKLRYFDFDLCAKTGTNGTEQGNLDAYSISYTTNHLIGVWVGNENGELMPNNITGGSYPTIIASEIISKLYSDNKPENFKVPSGIIYENIDTNSLYTNQVPLITTKEENSKKFAYKIGTEPKNYLKVDTVPKIENAKINLLSGKILINFDSLNAKTIKIYENSKLIYEGNVINNFTKQLKDFGKYDYLLEVYNNLGEKSSYKFPTVSYDISNLKILDENWWED